MGKSTSLNAIEAARVYHLLGAPGVIATGGIVHPGEQRRSEADVLCDGLVRLGIPRDHIVVESRARNTREQASFSADLLRRRGQTRVVLITDAEHMPRAMAMFREQGLDPIPSVSVLAETTPPGIFHQIRPTLNAFLQSDRACYEYAARLYYWVQGFLGHKNG